MTTIQRGTGGWVEPFSFTEDEKEQLLSVWKRKSQHSNAREFVNLAEHIVELWKSLDAPVDAEEMRTRAVEIEKAASVLARALGNAPPEFMDMLEAELVAVTRNHRSRVHEAWTHDLDQLIEASGRVSALKNTGGEDRRKEKHLVAMLATEYRKVFGRPAPKGEDTNFRKFYLELCTIRGEPPLSKNTFNEFLGSI
ncbi:hypothetical protein LV476_05230 [Guyparkeria hydrothermalis]|uniref:hypothetical protein n=1 Tax=Guyparkeria hydrothermalis TaxID=923 RepID=UPI002020DCD7|nr:hypothetical protein [Guyparkeria hydrothermalis]MCL7744354.1 hypothetical protein [Guyparkeria hydrothermalis]